MKNYEKKELYNTEATTAIAENYRKIITGIGEDVTREGLEKTRGESSKSDAVFNAWLRLRSVRNIEISFVYRGP